MSAIRSSTPKEAKPSVWGTPAAAVRLPSAVASMVCAAKKGAVSQPDADNVSGLNDRRERSRPEPHLDTRRVQ